MKKQRLDRFISNQLNLPRTMSKTQIHRGKVKVNGEILRDPSAVIDPKTANITYKGEQVSYDEFIYILMNKPKGVLSATEDKNQKTVVDLIPDGMRRKDLAPVGRLDKDTTGLLIITDDGDFSHRCIHPSKKIEKTYIAKLDGELKPEMTEIFAAGITLADGTVCKPAKLRIVDDFTAEITITEGKYHQIKRMFKIVGLGVNELERRSIGSLVLPENLKCGECVKLSRNDLSKVFL